MSKQRLARWAVYVAVAGAVGLGVAAARAASAAESPTGPRVNRVPAVAPVDGSQGTSTGEQSDISGTSEQELTWD